MSSFHLGRSAPGAGVERWKNVSYKEIQKLKPPNFQLTVGKFTSLPVLNRLRHKF